LLASAPSSCKRGSTRRSRARNARRHRFEPIFDGAAQAQLIALACTEPPPGYARWTIRLLAEKVVEMEIVEAAHFNTVGRALKKTISSLT
jgi:hypothetical protein